MNEDLASIDPLAPLPRLRQLEAIPVDQDGERRVVLRDPLEVAEGMLVVPVPVYYMTAQLDGQSSIRDLQEDFTSRFGQVVSAEQVAEMVQKLDDGLFLDTPRFHEAFQSVQKAFFDAEVRPAILAGSAYPAEAGEALEAVDGFFSHSRGPGPLVEGVNTGPRQAIRAIFSPHYDTRRGGFMLAHAYLALARAPDVDRVVVLGTNHQPSTERYTATRKRFATPFGPLSVDETFLDHIEHHYAGDLYKDEFSHRREHSVEFQALMLAYVWKKLGRGEPPPIVPVLVGSFHDLFDSNPMDDLRVKSFVAGFEAAEAEEGGTTIIVASGDLAHVGLRFGDPDPMEGPFLETVKAEDRTLMETLAAGEALSFHHFIARNRDQYHVCGYPCAYTMLAAIRGEVDGRGGGTILDYEMAVDPDGAVSYCAIAFPA